MEGEWGRKFGNRNQKFEMRRNPPYDGSVKRLTIRVSDSLFAEIDAAARLRGVTRSEIVRERLERAGSGKASLWSRMEDLVIDGDSLPRDLSSGAGHLREYGKNRANRQN